MLDFERYQTDFTAHIRAPKLHKKPANVNTARMAVYQNAVFNNMAESVNVCFPVCQAVLGKRAWQKLMREFVANFAAASPIFKDIPAQFLQFITAKKELSSYFAALAHYEWAELAVSHLPANNKDLSKKTDLLKQIPILAPHLLLQYDFAVHKITKNKKPKQIDITQILIYRNAEYEVKFIELNPMAFSLLKQLEEEKMAGAQALARLAEHTKHIDANVMVKFGGEMLHQLLDAGAILGSTAA